MSNNKGRRVLWICSILGAFLLLFVSYHVFYSEQIVEKRFLKALTEEQTKKITKITYHDNASSITKGEAEALIRLHKNTEIDRNLYEIKPKKVLFGLLKKNEVHMKSFYASYDDWFEGLTLTFNNEEIPIHDKVEHHLEYGPLVPGIYDVKASFLGVDRSGGGEETITLEKKKLTRITIPLDVSTVTFSVKNAEVIGRDAIRIHWNDETYKITETGKTNRIGPIVLDGTEEAAVIVDFPWGQVRSDPVAITSSEMDLTVEPLTVDEQAKVHKQIVHFADTYVESLVNGTTNSLTNSEEDVVSVVKSHITENASIYMDSQLKARLNHVKVTLNERATDWSAKEPILVFDAMFQVDDLTDYKPALNIGKQLKENYMFKLGLTYSKEQDEWSIASLKPLESWSKKIDDITHLEGEKTLYTSNRDGIKTEQITKHVQSEVESEIHQLVENYKTALVKTWNEKNISHVETFFTADSLRYSKSLDELEAIKEKEKWKLKDIQFKKVLKVNEMVYDVTTEEKYEVKQGKSTENILFRIVTRVKRVGDRSFKVYDEVSKEEID